MTLNGNTQVNVTNNNQANGGTSGLQVNGIANSNNANLDKWGNGYLFINGPSSGFVGGTINIQQGAIQVNNVNGLGTPATVNVSRYGILDVAVPQYGQTVNYTAGGIERWSVDNARIGALNLGAGTLQINADQTSSAGGLQVNVSGGSIEGFLRTDANETVVYRTVGSGVTFNVGSGGFSVGQDLAGGLNGLDNGVVSNIFSPFGNAAQGAILQINGVISGAGAGASLTKQGFDTVVLAGANTYGGRDHGSGRHAQNRRDQRSANDHGPDYGRSRCLRSEWLRPDRQLRERRDRQRWLHHQ